MSVFRSSDVRHIMDQPLSAAATPVNQVRSIRQLPSSIRRQQPHHQPQQPFSSTATQLTPPIHPSSLPPSSSSSSSQPQLSYQGNNIPVLTAVSVAPPPQVQEVQSVQQRILPPPRLTTEHLQKSKDTFNKVLNELLGYLCNLTDNHPKIKETLANLGWARTNLLGLTDKIPFQRLHKQVGPYREIIIKLNSIPLKKRTVMIEYFCQVWPAIEILIDTFSEELAEYKSVIEKMGRMTLSDRVGAINHIWPNIILLCDLSFMLSEPTAYQYELDMQFAVQVCRTRGYQPTKENIESVLRQIPSLLKSGVNTTRAT